MKGWRARLGFLVPPGNPTVEPELFAMTPPGVSVHFSRLVARGPAGTHHGQEERNRSQIEHIDESASLLAMVKPNVIVLAHTATSYTLGRSAEAALLQRLQAQYAIPFATAFGSVAAALGELGVERVALGTPYSEEITLKGKAHLEEHGFDVVSHGRLKNVTKSTSRRPSAPTGWGARWMLHKRKPSFSAAPACPPSRSSRRWSKTSASRRSPPTPP